MTQAAQRTVAIIDDDGVRDAMNALVQAMGLKAEGFASAAAFFSATPTKFSRLIVDHHMPAMTGLELAERLRSEGVETPIMLLSGALSPEIVRRAHSLGIEPVVEKPASLEDLSSFFEGE
jgi:FixJ family two-component response regulator